MEEKSPPCTALTIAPQTPPPNSFGDTPCNAVLAIDTGLQGQDLSVVSLYIQIRLSERNRTVLKGSWFRAPRQVHTLAPSQFPLLLCAPPPRAPPPARGRARGIPAGPMSVKQQKLKMQIISQLQAWSLQTVFLGKC